MTAGVVAWCLLLVPAAALHGHVCYGFVGFLAHSPLYAFYALSAVLALAVAVRLGRSLGSTSLR